MAGEQFPLIVFPRQSKADKREDGNRYVPPALVLPSTKHQSQRIGPKLKKLEDAFEARRLALSPNEPLQNPELVLVLETIGSYSAFAKAVQKVPGLEWLVDFDEEDAPPSDGFRFKDDGKKRVALPRTAYLIGSDLQALNQLMTLWNLYRKNPNGKMERGLTPFRDVFAHLQDIRPWGITDRIDGEMREYWAGRIHEGEKVIRFEIEAWYYTSQTKNASATKELHNKVEILKGRILCESLISQIAYHGFLVELPSAAIQSILEGKEPDLLLSDRIMYFRPKAQSLADCGTVESSTTPIAPKLPAATLPPVVALLDGMPMENHDLLSGRLRVDDPDGWASTYQVRDRVHGTAMASLILHGELDAQSPSPYEVYVRPVLRPDLSDPSERKTEHTPDDVLLIDLIHRAVMRIVKGSAEEPPVAPTVRVVNISLGHADKIFGRSLSPWARLLDWLSWEFNLLFVVSAGNISKPLGLESLRDDFPGLTDEQRASLTLRALLADSSDRRLMSPAEAINVLTVGAAHMDASTPVIPASRYDLSTGNPISPISRIGHGHRRSIKPEILMSGGRVLHLVKPDCKKDECVVSVISQSVSPGHKVAATPVRGGSTSETRYCRGTSNAAALTSRAAAEAYGMLSRLRGSGEGAKLAPEFDAVLLKALLVHGASWGDAADVLLKHCPAEIASMPRSSVKDRAEREFVARWLGYGPADVSRALYCADNLATLIGVGKVAKDEAMEFSAPLPPGLSGTKIPRRLTITLAWLSPTNSQDQRYRRAKLWIVPPSGSFGVGRENTVMHDGARRGTVQHEILEGNQALGYVSGTNFVCKVNCLADGGDFKDSIPFALCVSLEVPVGCGVSIYQEIRQLIQPAVPVRA
jgi:hypothetical protein